MFSPFIAGLASFAVFFSIQSQASESLAERLRDESRAIFAADRTMSAGETRELGPTDSSARSPLVFSRACEAGRTFIIAGVGDVLLHQPLASQGMRDTFRSLWTGVEGWIAGATFAYANLEGPAAGAVSASGRVVADPGRRFDGVAYTGYPQFNYHPSLVADLKESGFDVVSSANNHSLDRQSLGANRTVAALEQNGLPFTGTLDSATVARETFAGANWSTVTEREGLRVAWIACTYGTNGIEDSKRQVLHCFRDQSVVLEQIRRADADPTIDLVVVTPHWGTEYQHVPGGKERALARDFADAGASIIFGSHPHVLQPAEKIVAASGRETYIIYSLGNFVSGQKPLPRRSTAMVFVGVTKNAAGETFVNGARHLPLVMDYGRTLSVRPSFGLEEPARALTNRVLSASRELLPTDAVVTNPECARSF